MNVIHKPHIPYVGLIPGGCRVGTQVVVEGHVPHWFMDRFAVNLMIGHNPTHDHTHHADIALHFNPRFDGEHVVVMTDRRGGMWGQEMREYGNQPFRKGYDFELQITVDPSFYRITVNGQHFANFPHRQSFNEVGLLHIDGRVDVRKIEFIQLGGGASLPYVPGQVFPATAPPQPVYPAAVRPAPVFPGQYQPAPTAPPVYPGQTYPPAPTYPPGHHHRHY